jgi:hypothetical protein
MHSRVYGDTEQRDCGRMHVYNTFGRDRRRLQPDDERTSDDHLQLIR